MLLEIRTNRLSTVQYCHACPTSNLLAIAFSNYTVEVHHTPLTQTHCTLTQLYLNTVAQFVNELI